ncbi:hypothetical protein SUGI_0535890 [Cryptomeria japonica]|uniref:transcription termination factor MTERF15, mitochondrial n=1 Tax=Cryptomeria japonica TaxID=3369 RepID=UPI002408B4F2|nr:transcription termination factor MTERF15, mitochondrial [Cryptomeria japonica]GLJ27303.1 hypothetical protein SUGI_0535890 [Cryptomeria japonica]
MIVRGRGSAVGLWSKFECIVKGVVAQENCRRRLLQLGGCLYPSHGLTIIPRSVFIKLESPSMCITFCNLIPPKDSSVTPKKSPTADSIFFHTQAARVTSIKGNIESKIHSGLEDKECPHDDEAILLIAAALEDHLCRKWNLSKADVSRAVKYAPKFVMKVKSLVNSINKNTESDGLRYEEGSLKNDYRAAVANLFSKDSALNEVGLFLESIGKEEEATEPQQIELCTDRGLVAVTRQLEWYGFPRIDVYSLIQQHEFLLNCCESELEKTLKTLESYGFNRETLSSLLYSCPYILKSEYLNQWHSLFSALHKYPNRASIIEKLLKYCVRFGLEPIGPENYKENIKFLSDNRIRSSSIGSCLEKCPLLFCLNRYTDLEPKIQVLTDCGVRKETVYHILRKYLNFLTYRATSLSLKIEYLKSIGLGREDMDQVFGNFPALLAHSIEDKLKPIVTELQSLGIRDQLLAKTIVDDPSVFSMRSGGELSRCVALLKNLKGRKAIQDRIFQQGLIKGCRLVKSRVEFLTKHGLSHREVLKLLEKEPRIILYDLHSIEEKVNFLTNDMGFPIRNLLSVPNFLGVNFQKQILPRHRVIAYLRSTGSLGVDVNLKEMMKLTRIQFYNKYVRPYPDCEKIFVNCTNEDKKPTTKWKRKQP